MAIAVLNLVGVPVGVALTQVGHFRWVALLGAAPVLAVPLALSLGAAAAAGPVAETPANAPPNGSWTAVRRVAAPSLVLLTVTLAGGGLVTFRLVPAALLAAVLGMAVVALGLHSGPASEVLVLLGAVVFGAGYGAVQNLTLVQAFTLAGPGRTTTLTGARVPGTLRGNVLS